MRTCVSGLLLAREGNSEGEPQLSAAFGRDAPVGPGVLLLKVVQPQKRAVDLPTVRILPLDAPTGHRDGALSPDSASIHEVFSLQSSQRDPSDFVLS